MKKISALLILMMFLLSFATGCSKAPTEASAETQNEVKKDVTAEKTEPKVTVSENSKPKSAEIKPAEKPAETAPEAEEETAAEILAKAGAYADERVSNLVKKAAEKTTSYRFYYQTSANWDLVRDQYFIKGDKIKIKLYEENMWNADNYFDTVYLDTAQKTAAAYCESPEKKRCKDLNKQFKVEYEDYKILTPLDWINVIPTDAKWQGSEQVDDRPADAVVFSTPDGKTTRMLMDKFSGVPAQVIIYKGDIENVVERYKFRELSVNSVKTSETEHQFATI